MESIFAIAPNFFDRQHARRETATMSSPFTAAYKTDASGRCTRKDKDGDLYSYEWMMPASGEKGSWKFVSGTGKYANAKWSGWWQQTMAEGKAAGGIWGGNCR